MTAPPASSTASARLRWATVDEEANARLPGLDPAERITHPEFRDIEFLHVRAKRLLNEVPAAADLPFRWTINTYRGCSHACTYCLAGDTAILLADGTTRPLDRIQKGDLVYGTIQRGQYRQYAVSEVLDHWQTLRRAYRVTLADGTQLCASADHRFLTYRGWKHVTGATSGAARRPHLTTNDELLGTGSFSPPPQINDDYRTGYLCGMIRGDANLGTYHYERAGRAHGDVHRFRLALADAEALDRTAEYLAHYGVTTKRFIFSEATSTRRGIEAIRASAESTVRCIEGLVGWPNDPSPDWTRGFLAGIFDAEGSCSRGVLRICNTDAEIIKHVTCGLAGLGFDFALEEPRDNMRVVRLRGGLAARQRFFHSTEPAIARKRDIQGVALKSKGSLRVVSVEDLGVDMPMYDLTTSTGDFIANGVVSHNCFARPSHEWLDLDAGRDFESVIVVKINAVERLRAELRRPSWQGEPVALGTNTDPYQRAEGRYRLTRGVLETLIAANNPFSILTKGTLVTRDLALLTDAADRGLCLGVSMSIPTLDEDVWRASEPGTPHPRARMETIAALAEARIPTGVMVAPIIPGLSDDEDGLDRVVRAAVEAGANSLTPIVLHLRPGVREVFAPWLEDLRPDLVERYRHWYRGSYAPKRLRAEIVGRFRRAVDRHGPLAPGPRPRRSAHDHRADADDDTIPLGNADQLRLLP